MKNQSWLSVETKNQLEIVQREKLNNDARAEFEKLQEKYDIYIKDDRLYIGEMYSQPFTDYISILPWLFQIEFILPRRGENLNKSIENE